MSVNFGWSINYPRYGRDSLQSSTLLSPLLKGCHFHISNIGCWLFYLRWWRAAYPQRFFEAPNPRAKSTAFRHLKKFVRLYRLLREICLLGTFLSLAMMGLHNWGLNWQGGNWQFETWKSQNWEEPTSDLSFHCVLEFLFMESAILLLRRKFCNYEPMMDVNGIGEDGFARRDTFGRRLTETEFVMAAAWYGLLLCIRKPNTRGTKGCDAWWGISSGNVIMNRWGKVVPK